jgi:hypothetical protein
VNRTVAKDVEAESPQGEGDRLIRFMFRHFLSLGWHVQPIDRQGNATGPSTGICTSGCLFEYRGLYSILTAGHVLKYIEKEFLKSGKYAVHGCCLLDSFGHEAVSKHPIPFVYEDAATFFIDDESEGLDFGLVSLSQYYLALIEKNGVVPIREENWRNQGQAQIEWYAMMGLPSCHTKVTNQAVGGRSFTDYGVSPTILRINRLDKAPADSRKTSYERFVGQIEGRVPIGDIAGMSGGPIVGFGKSDGRDAYWVVAIQSGWLPRRRITFGCPVPTIGGLLDEYTEAFLSESEKGPQ